MQIIRYGPLKQKLRERSFTDQEALPYLALFCAITALVASFPFIVVIEDWNQWDVFSGLVSVALAVGGVYYAYRQNGGNSGHDLIQKYVTLGWVLGVRFVIVVVPAAFVLYGLAAYVLDTFQDATGPFDVLVMLVIELVFYQRLGRHIQDTAPRASTSVTEGGLTQ